MASDSPYPDLGFQPGFPQPLPFPWGFKVDGRSPSDANFGPQRQAAVEVMMIYSDDLLNTMGQPTLNPLSLLLGYSWRDASTFVDGVSPARLRRQLPWQHPLYNQLYCTQIVKVEGLGPEGKIEETYGSFEQYEIILLTLQFTRPPYALLEDNEVMLDPETGLPEEWLRYTTWIWDPGVEFLSREGQSFVYTTSGTPAVGQQFPGSLGYPVCKLKFTLTWHQIPEIGVYDADRFPYNLLYDFSSGDRLPGTVNDASFFGRPEEQFLYIVPEIIPRPLQLPPALMNIFGGEQNGIVLQYDVKVHMLFFDPPLGPTETGPGGHNCAPWADLNWYRVASKQGTNPPFDSSSFPSIFQIN